MVRFFGKKLFLFQSYYVAPSCGGVSAFEIVLDGVGENFGFACTVLRWILLRAKHYGFGAINLVDTVYHCVETAHFGYHFGIGVKKVLLNGAVGRYAHNYHSRFFVPVSRTVKLLQRTFKALRAYNQ